MNQMQKIRIGGVPEHFNHPWHLAMEGNLFSNLGIELEWITFKGGTGAMNQALRNDEVDFCIVLTEGIIKDIAAGNPSKIISHYVESPLTWGIFSGAMNPITSNEIFTKKVAISRKGSGSHLMPQIHAREANQVISNNQFQIIKNLDGAIESLSSLESDVFYWENFTTKPYVDKGIFKKIGEFKPPWPCFVIAGREQSIEKFENEIRAVLNNVFTVAADFYKSNNRIKIISQAYDIHEDDVSEWFDQLSWSSQVGVEKQMISNVLNLLKSSEMINDDSSVTLELLIHDLR